MGIKIFDLGEVKSYFPGDMPKGEGRIWQPEGEPFLWIEENGKKGGAEAHQGFQDVFVVLEGNPVFVTGGELVDPVEKSPGELRAAEISGGGRVMLKPGDVFSVPPGTPHQRFANGRIFLLVFKFSFFYIIN